MTRILQRRALIMGGGAVLSFVLANLTAITWLYRGEQDKFVELLATYQVKLQQHLSQ